MKQSDSNSYNNRQSTAKKIPVAKASPKKKLKSPIDDVFGQHRHSIQQYSYRRRNGNNESTAAGNYIATKTKYKRLPDHPQQQQQQQHQYHRSQQQQQQQHQHRPHLGGKKESTSPRKQLCTVPRRRVQNYKQHENYSLKRPRHFHSSSNQPQHLSYSYQSSKTSSAGTSKFYEMKLPDLKRIQEKEKENSTVTTFPCWIKGSRNGNHQTDATITSNLTANTTNDSSAKKPPRKSSGGKNIQDIIHHIRDVGDGTYASNTYNVEMNLLTQYIQLHPNEIQLRNQFVSQLEEQIIQQLPSIGQSNPSKSSNSKYPQRHTKYCHVFGSFASIPICTFQSDLDIALFNVGIEGNYKTTDSTTVTSSSTAVTTAVSEDQTNTSDDEIIPQHEIILIGDDDDAEKLPHSTEDSKNIASTSTSTAAATTITKQQRKAKLVEKWKLALEQITSSTTSDVVTKAATTHDDIMYGMDNDNAIQLYNDSDFDTDSDENDSADPMNRFQDFDDGANDEEDDESTDDFNINDKRGRKRAYSDSTILSMNSQNGATSVEEKPDMLTVSFFASKPPPTSTTAIGPQGHVRIKVVAMLATLCNKLRKKAISRSMQIQNVTFIKTARVPIIKIQLLSGFNVDIAVGGYGTDTSLYAAQQIQLYPNIFVPVVVLLKVLLAQHNLDEPYTGGLGSYKLYILIADHIYRHQQWCQDRSNGCFDNYDRIGPFEILFTFLYRYGYGGNDMQNRQVLQYPTTALHQHRPVVSANDSSTSADLSNVYKLHDCITLFRLCFHRLYQQILFLQVQQRQASTPRPPQSSSLLAHVICPFQLQSSRERILQQTKQYASKTVSVSSASSTSGTTNEESLRNQNVSNAIHPSPTTASTSNNLPLQDRTRDEILAGYERVFC